MKTIIFIILTVLTAECSSQIIQEQSYISQLWKAEFGGEGVADMTTDDAGNVYVTGTRVDNNSDWVTIKYSPTGERLWFANFSDNHSDIPHAIAVDNLGNVYVTGETNYLSSAYYLTIKYNSQGVEQWQKRYGGPGVDVAYGIAIDASRNVYVTGKYMHSGNLDCVTVKYTSGGTLLWDKTYDGPTHGYDMATEISAASDGSIYVAGRTENPTTGYDYLLIKYNSAGEEQWVKTLDGPAHGNDIVRKMVLGYNSSIFLTGYSDGSGTDNDYLTVRYNTAGFIQWSKRYNGPVNGDDRAASIAVDGLGNTFVTGYSKSNTGYDFATVKYSLNGTFQWLNREDGGNYYNDYARDIAIDNDGDVYVTGVFEKDDYDYQLATVKYNSSGIQKWLKKFNNPEGRVSEGSCIIVDGSKNIYIGGGSDRAGLEHIGFYPSSLVVKYTQSRFVIQNRTEIPGTFSLSQNYPNPFNPVTNIEFSIPDNTAAKLIVYDISGKQVEELVNAELTAGTYKIDFDASHLASSTYFYRLEAGNFSEVKKMILVK